MHKEPTIDIICSCAFVSYGIVSDTVTLLGPMDLRAAFDTVDQDIPRFVWGGVGFARP